MAGTLEIGTIKKGTASTDVDNVINGCAKAWVNFNGTGTVAIRASYKVSSITDNGTGDYTVNLTTAFSDTNYSFVANCSALPGTAPMMASICLARVSDTFVTPVVGAFRVSSINSANGAAYDTQYINAAVFR